MEFSDIQPVSTNGQLQPTSISDATGLLSFFNSRANAGDQVEMFFAIAEGHPEMVTTDFREIVEKLNRQPIKAVALQGFGKIPQPYKQALGLCASEESKDILKLLCSDIKNPSSDLTAWAAAEALREIGFSSDNIQHTQGGNLHEPPRRIQNEILDRKIQEINKVQRRFNAQGEPTADYERFLEFWVYGPTSDFLNQNITTYNYLEVVQDVLNFTQVRGVQIGLNSSNKEVQKISLEKVELILSQYIGSSQGEFKQALGNSLKRFLKEDNYDEADLQVLAEAFIHEAPRYNIDDSRLSRLTKDQIEKEISQLDSLCSKVSSIFSSAINVSNEKTINYFLLNKKNTWTNLINSWIKRLEDQVRIISEPLTALKHNSDLIISVLNSIRGYDEALYLKIADDINKRLHKLNSCNMETQEEQDSAYSELTEIKNFLNSSLQNKLGQLKSEMSTLERSSSRKKDESKGRFKTGAIWFAVGIFWPLAVAIVILIFITGMLGGGGA